MSQLSKMDFIEDGRDILSFTEKLEQSQAQLTENLKGHIQKMAVHSEAQGQELKMSREKEALLQNQAKELQQKISAEVAARQVLSHHYQELQARYSDLHSQWQQFQVLLQSELVLPEQGPKTVTAGAIRQWLNRLKEHLVKNEAEKNQMRSQYAEREEHIQKQKREHQSTLAQQKAEIARFKTAYVQLQRDSALLEKKVRASAAAKDSGHGELSGLLQKLQAETLELRSLNNKLIHQIQKMEEAKDREGQAHQAFVASLQAEAVKLARDVATAQEQASQASQALQARNEQSRREAAAFEQSKKSLHRVIEVLEAKVQIHKDESASALKKLRLAEESQEAQAIELRQKIEKLQTQIAEREAQAHQIKVEQQNAIDQIEEARRAQSEEYREDRSHLRLSLLELEREVKQLKAQVQVAQAELAGRDIYKLEVKRLLAAAAASEEKTRSLQQDRTSLHLSLSQRQSELQALEQKIMGLENEAHTLRAQNQVYQIQISDSESSINRGLEKLHLAGEDQSARERQLNSYADSLNRAKQELRDQVNRFDYELQMARSVNPIADYLKITEHEIRRVDLQLKKTPAISKDRLRLEECLDELYEQRDFLAKHSSRTTNDLESRRQRLIKILGADALQASPPPPPRAVALR